MSDTSIAVRRRNAAPPAGSFPAGWPARFVATRALQKTAALLYKREWCVGTSGNFSVVLATQPLRLLITASGRDKGRLTEHDFVVVDAGGTPIEAGSPTPSAETLLHTLLADRGAGAVLHTHSIANTVLSDLHAPSNQLVLAGYEMLKGLAGVKTHAARVAIPIFDNSQDIPVLATQVAAWLDATTAQRTGSTSLPTAIAEQPAWPAPAFLLRGHGLYTWGRDLDEARRHVEVLEFLFEVLARRGVLEAEARSCAAADR